MENKTTELKKLLKLAQKFRVKRLKVDNIEFELELPPPKEIKNTAQKLPIAQRPRESVFPPDILFAAVEDIQGDEPAETAS